MEDKKQIKTTNEKEMNVKKKRNIILVAVLLIATNLITFLIAANGLVTLSDSIVIKNDDPVVLNELKKINDLEKVVMGHFYQETDSQTLMNGAIRGLFDSLGDEYSYYFTPEEYEILVEYQEGSFQGIGILVTGDEADNTVVITPYKDTPAGNAGIQSGDVIAAVDGEDMKGKGMNYAVSKMRGEKGTSVTVSVDRDGQILEFVMTRDVINVPSVEGKILDDGFGYIEITEFIEPTGADFAKKLDELEAQNIKGLIIDLRYNGGGLVDQAVAVADRLMGEGDVVTLIDRWENTVYTYTTTSDQSFSKPIVVLVNNGSASSSEILTAALQDRKAAMVVGTQTFGKGIVQDVQKLKDGSGYQLTTYKYLTPNGTAIHKIGITPDVVVEQPKEYENVLSVPFESDTQLQKAIELLK